MMEEEMIIISDDTYEGMDEDSFQLSQKEKDEFNEIIKKVLSKY